jgi:hypothetical protein
MNHMNSISRNFFLAGIALALAGCANVDVVAKYAASSFAAVINEANVSRNENDAEWVIASPGGETLSIADDFSASGVDFSITINAAPFVDAGLDYEKLPANFGFDKEKGSMTLFFDTGTKPLPGDPKKSLLDAFMGIITTYRSNVGYHKQFDHYGIALGNGNMFEWASNIATNDKDIVFVLNPDPFIKAGLDPAKTAGWVFTKVTVRDDSGKDIQVDKLVKPYNLK